MAGEKILIAKSYIRVGTKNITNEDGWFFITSKQLILRSNDHLDDKNYTFNEIDVDIANSERLFSYSGAFAHRIGWENQPYLVINSFKDLQYYLPMKLRGWDFKYRIH